MTVYFQLTLNSYFKKIKCTSKNKILKWDYVCLSQPSPSLQEKVDKWDRNNAGDKKALSLRVSEGTSKNSFFFVIKNQNTLKLFKKLIKIFPIFNF